MSRPFTYELVSSAGYCFVMAGVSIFLQYLRTSNKRDLIISSSLMALAVACRPTMIFASILIFVKIIFDIISKKDKYEKIKIGLNVLIPYAIVGILLMIYNYMRFGNIFEFGANYQISVTDFRNFGFNINRVIIGIVTYLFSPLKFISDFPFVISENWLPEYNGFYYSQPIGGGYFVTSIIGMVIILIPFIYKKLKEFNKEMFIFIILNIFLGVFLIIFESNKCGSLGRYMLDFSWLFNISAILIILFLFNKIRNGEIKSIFTRVLLFMILFSCLNNSLVIYSNENNLLNKDNNLKGYYFIDYMFCFWK